MKKGKVKFDLEDDFEVGDCYDCPLYAVLGEGMYGDTEMACQLGYQSSECPIEFE